MFVEASVTIASPSLAAMASEQNLISRHNSDALALDSPSQQRVSFPTTSTASGAPHTWDASASRSSNDSVSSGVIPACCLKDSESEATSCPAACVTVPDTLECPFCAAVTD